MLRYLRHCAINIHVLIIYRRPVSHTYYKSQKGPSGLQCRAGWRQLVSAPCRLAGERTEQIARAIRTCSACLLERALTPRPSQSPVCTLASDRL